MRKLALSVLVAGLVFFYQRAEAFQLFKPKRSESYKELCRLLPQRAYLKLSEKLKKVKLEADAPDCALRAAAYVNILENRCAEALNYLDRIKSPNTIDMVNYTACIAKLGRVPGQSVNKAVLTYYQTKDWRIAYNLAIYFIKTKEFNKARKFLIEALNSNQLPPTYERNSGMLLDYTIKKISEVTPKATP